MKINLLAFGQIADITGQANWQLQDIMDTDALIQLLYSQYPALKETEFSLAVNKKLIHSNCVLQQEDTVALLPPFSGG